MLDAKTWKVLQRVICLSFGLALVFSPGLEAQGYDQQIHQLATNLGDKLAASGKKNVAVVDFTDLQGNTTELGRFLAEEMSVALGTIAKGYRVIDRTHLKAILQENKLATTGIIDPLTARKLGQIAGVESLVTGTLTAFGDSVRLTAKVLDTTSAEMLAASTADIPKTKAIDELLARGIGTTPAAQPASGNAMPTGTPAQSGNALPKAQAGTFSFVARGCTVSGQKITCVVSVTHGGSKRAQIGLNQSYLVDDSGNRFGWEQQQQMAFANGSTDSTLEPSLPVNVTFVIPNFPGQATSVNIVLAGYGYEEGSSMENFSATVRNIPVVRR